MAGKRSNEPSPESMARAERLRLAREEGAKAMADVTRDAVAVRRNMERLRALRQAREAEQASLPQADAPETAGKKRKGKVRSS